MSWSDFRYWFHKLASPPYFYAAIERWIPWLSAATAIFLIVGLYWSLFVAPPDYQQGESVRIMYIHVPAAWMSMFIYMVMVGAAATGMIWKIKIAEIIAVSSAPLGAWFTFLALATGSLWGKPMWGTWWVWDARLTSELILLFLYLGFIALQAAIPDRQTAARAGAVLALVGVVNIPIIHFSVEWWNTLHQPSSIIRLGKPTIHPQMLWPLLIMALAFKLYYATTVLLRTRCELLERERNSAWVREMVVEVSNKFPTHENVG
ncbi:cytochrome c maturation protein C [Gammaproteobacteria bacterium]